MPSNQYTYSHVKDKTWESPSLGKTLFIFRRGPGYDGIHVKFLKLVDASLTSNLHTRFNKFRESCTFHTSMKTADIFPIYRKRDDLYKNNYRLVNLLSAFSKLFTAMGTSKDSWRNH